MPGFEYRSSESWRGMPLVHVAFGRREGGRYRGGPRCAWTRRGGRRSSRPGLRRDRGRGARDYGSRRRRSTSGRGGQAGIGWLASGGLGLLLETVGEGVATIDDGIICVSRNGRLWPERTSTPTAASIRGPSPR